MEFKLLKGANLIKNESEVKKIADDMFNEVAKDKEVIEYLNRLGIKDESTIKRHIGSISLIKEDLDYCRNCPGLHNCNKRHPHYIFNLKYNGEVLDKTLVPCELKIKDTINNKSYLVSDFPDEWKESEITKLDRSKVRMPLIKRYSEIMNTNRNWIFITGSHRSGKSFIAATIINDLIKRHHGLSAFLNYPDRVKELQDYTYYNKDDFSKLMKMYTTVDYLVLDDFGNEYKSEYVRDSITLAILNERARRGLITIFTSEFNIEEIASMYSLNFAGKARGRQIEKLLTTYAESEIDISTAAIY